MTWLITKRDKKWAVGKSGSLTPPRLFSSEAAAKAYAEATCPAPPKKEEPMASDTKRLGNKLSGFRDKLGKLIEGAESEIDKAHTEAETSVGNVVSHVKGTVAELAELGAQLAEDTNSPPTPTKKGFLG